MADVDLYSDEMFNDSLFSEEDLDTSIAPAVQEKPKRLDIFEYFRRINSQSEKDSSIISEPTVSKRYDKASFYHTVLLLNSALSAPVPERLNQDIDDYCVTVGFNVTRESLRMADPSQIMLKPGKSIKEGRAALSKALPQLFRHLERLFVDNEVPEKQKLVPLPSLGLDGNPLFSKSMRRLISIVGPFYPQQFEIDYELNFPASADGRHDPRVLACLSKLFRGIIHALDTDANEAIFHIKNAVNDEAEIKNDVENANKLLDELDEKERRFRVDKPVRKDLEKKLDLISLGIWPSSQDIKNLEMAGRLDRKFQPSLETLLAEQSYKTMIARQEQRSKGDIVQKIERLSNLNVEAVSLRKELKSFERRMLPFNRIINEIMKDPNYEAQLRERIIKSTNV